jgi:hypothetical protein
VSSELEDDMRGREDHAIICRRAEHADPVVRNQIYFRIRRPEGDHYPR